MSNSSGVPTRSIWLYIALISILASWQGVQAASQISTDTECGTCVGAGSVVCRPTFYDRYSFCCDETEIGSTSCGGSSVFCTTQSLNPLMNAFACPYSYSYCGASSSEIVMHPTDRNNIAIEIQNRLFLDAETCYYVFNVPTRDLDQENMRYFWDIEVKEMSNVVIQINNGTSLYAANDPIQVSFTTGYRFQFTAENNQVFMAFTGDAATSATSTPLFSVNVKLRSFELNPTSPTDSTDVTVPTEPENPIIVDPVVPVVPVVPDPVDPIIPIDSGTEVTPTVVPSDDGTISEPIIETIIQRETKYVPSPTTMREISEKQKGTRKKQVGLTVLTGVSVLGILFYISLSFCSKCVKKSAERKQVKTMSSFNTIEIAPASMTQSNMPLASDTQGLMGNPALDDNADDFGEKTANRKVKISEAIEDDDAGKKKIPLGKKTKKKKKANNKGKDADMNMLSVNNVDDHVDSWNSARSGAQVADFSKATPQASMLPDVHGFGSNSKTRVKKNFSQLEMSEKNSANHLGLSNNGSAAKLSVRDQLEELEEAVDMSARGSVEGIPSAGNFRQVTANRTQKMNISEYGLGDQGDRLGKRHPSDMALGGERDRPPATGYSMNMMATAPKTHASHQQILGTEGNSNFINQQTDGGAASGNRESSLQSQSAKPF